ncbi:MAG: nucleobase:cation symporter-2 family protein [Candidatus Xenobiia bacterium LiM19]
MKLNRGVVDEMLPPGKTVLLGFQHVLAMYAGAVAVPLIIGSALSLSKQHIAMLINADLFTCGIATLLQTLGFTRFVGIRLPVLLGVSFAALSTMMSVGTNLGMPYVYGSILISGLFVVIFAGFLSRFRTFFPPIVVGTVLLIIGSSLMKVGFQWAAGGSNSPDYGSPLNFMTSLAVLVIIIVITRFGKGFFSSVAVLVGMAAASLVWLIMGRISLEGINSEPWVALTTPFWFGVPKFDAIAIINMILVACVNVVESIGVFISAGAICEVDIKEKDITSGLRAEGFAVILGSFLNSFPYVTYGQNLGLLTLTRVKSRFVVALAGVILVILGIFPKIGFIVASIPDAVLGGAAIVMFGMVISTGISIMKSVDYSSLENLFIIAVSSGAGLGVSLTPEAFTHLPDSLRLVFSNGVVVGTIAAVLLNLIFNGVKREKSSVDV